MLVVLGVGGLWGFKGGRGVRVVRRFGDLRARGLRVVRRFGDLGGRGLRVVRRF